MDGFHVDSDGFERLFGEEVDRYFCALLPRYLTRYYRGGGYSFLAQMLQAHDQDTFDRQLAEVTPSRRSLKRARAVRAACPPVAVAGLPPNPVLGLFIHDTETRARSRVDFDVRSQRRVEIYLDVILVHRAWPDEAALRREIQKTLFHEYIHYFESFLLSSQQALRRREQEDPGARLDLAWARRKDRRVRLWRWSWATLAGLVALGLAGAWLAERWHRLMDVPEVSRSAYQNLTAAQLGERLGEIVRYQLPTSGATRWVGKGPIFSTFEPGAAVEVNRLRFSMDLEGPMELFPLVDHLGCWVADLDQVLERSYACVGWSSAGAAVLLGARMTL